MGKYDVCVDPVLERSLGIVVEEALSAGVMLLQIEMLVRASG